MRVGAGGCVSSTRRRSHTKWCLRWFFMSSKDRLRLRWSAIDAQRTSRASAGTTDASLGEGGSNPNKPQSL